MAFPVSVLAFGPAGLAIAVVHFVVQTVLTWTLGLFIASRSHLSGVAAVFQVFKVPALYAIAVSLAVQAGGWEIPVTLSRPIGLLADAAIPVMLVVLGFQFASGLKLDQPFSLSMVLVLRLVGAAPVAFVATWLVGLQGADQQVVIVVSAMPAAVFLTILATEFGGLPRFVTAAVVTGTVLSLGTLTVTITLVQRWLG